MELSIRLTCAVLALATIIHFGCICNFLSHCATKKIKATAVACVVTGAMLLGCAVDKECIDDTVVYLLLMTISMMCYELAKWIDGLNLCDFYKNRFGDGDD